MVEIKTATKGKRMKSRALILAVLLAGLLLPHPAASGKRSWEVIPYVWFTGIKGTMTVEVELKGIDASMGDVWDNSNAGGTARCETWNGSNGFYLDLFHVNLTDRYVRDEVEIIPASKIFFLDLAYTYELGSTPVFIDQRELSNKEIRFLSFGVLVGGRYFYLKNSLERSNDENLSQTGQFIDPIVGGYLRYRLAESVTFVTAADIGGFGIGSKFTWNAWARMDFRIANWLWVNGLYRTFDIDYEEGSGDDKIGLNARISGPAAGLVFRF